MSKKRYTNQKGSSKQRGIDFTLTYDEWLSVWKMSGVEPCKTHCISRINDTGPYTLGNVFVQKVSENSREASIKNKFAWKPSEVRLCISLFLDGKNVKELSDIFKRPVGGVINILRRHLDMEKWQPRYFEQVKPYN